VVPGLKSRNTNTAGAAFGDWAGVGTLALQGRGGAQGMARVEG